MAFLTDTLNSRIDLAQAIANWIERANETAAKRRLRRETISELQSLSNKELADIGIARAEIRGIAHRVAFGQDK